MASRYKPILMARIEAVEKEAAKQKHLREDSGIAEEHLIVVERGIQDYLFLGIKYSGYVIYTILIFFGLLTVLNPASRLLIVNILK